MNIELKHVRQFIVLAETLNFHRAAETLAIAQPALSRNIQALEQRIGVPLLMRNNRLVTLTPAGTAFLAASTGLASQLEHAIFRARQAHHGQTGEINIGYTGFAIAGVLPRLLKTYRQRYPGVALNLQYAATEQQMEWLETGKLDIAFLTAPVDSEELTHLPVQRETLGVCLPISHPMAGEQAIELPSLRDQHWVFGTPVLWRHYRMLTDRLFAQAGFIPHIVQEAPTTDCIMGLVAAGLGITIHVANANARHPDEVAFIPLAGPTPPLVTEAVWRSSDENIILQHFVQQMHTVLNYVSLL